MDKEKGTRKFYILLTIIVSNFQTKGPRRFPAPGALASKTKGQPTDWRRTSRRLDAGRCARRTGAHSPAGCGRG